MYEPGTFAAFLPLIVLTIPIVFICNRIAKEKHKNVTLWTVLGLIPAVNYFALFYLIGSANTVLEKKLDTVLELLQKSEAGQSR